MTYDPNGFFNWNDTLHRVLFLYGHTDDTYFVSGTKQNSMEYMLEDHLKKMGYDLVLFYNGIQRLYCYSDSMAKKRDEVFGDYLHVGAQRSREIEADLMDFLSPEETAPRPARQEEVQLRIEMHDNQIATFADMVMRREDIRTAFVFSDGWDVLENTDPETLRTFTNRIRSWYHLGANNHNIAIMCFSTLTQAQLTECIRHVPSWSFLQDKLIKGNTFSDAVKYISIPGKDEIEGRLYMESDYRNLSLSDREKVVASAQCLLHSMGNTLKGLDKYLMTMPNAISLLLEADDDDKQAWEILQNTRGWEPVFEVVKRISNNINLASKKPEKKDDSQILRRMRENPPFLPAGISCNIVLTGNPGTGKTTIAKLLGKIFRQLKLLPSGHVVETARDDLVGRYVGHTAANTRAKIEEAMGGILFIDEAYSLYRHDQNAGSNDFGIEAIDTLTEAMTRSVGSFAVVLAGYPDEMDRMLKANPGLLSRFGEGNVVLIKDYEPELLQEISTNYLHTQFAHKGITFDSSLLTPGVTGNKPLDVFFRGWYEARNRKQFGNARDCRNLVNRLAESADCRNAKTIIVEDFPENLRCYFKEADLDINTVLNSLDDVIGQEQLKEQLKSIIKSLRLRNMQQKAKPDVKLKKVIPGHYLFCGNPGTGKTLVSDKVAQVLGALRMVGRFTPTRVTGSMLISVYHRQGIEGVKEVINNARGSVLFIDEAHQLINHKIILQLFLDPMIEMKDELCVIFACYEHAVQDLFQEEAGLESRIKEIYHFADYTVDELYAIFEKKVQAAGYILSATAEPAVRDWFSKHLQYDRVSRNGRYAEQLLTLIEERMASRLVEVEAPLTETELFLILPEDIPFVEVETQT